MGLLSSSILITLPLFACVGRSVLDKQENVAPTILVFLILMALRFKMGILSIFVPRFQTMIMILELQIAWYVGEEIVCDWMAASPSLETRTVKSSSLKETKMLLWRFEIHKERGEELRFLCLYFPLKAPIVPCIAPFRE